MTGTVDGPLLAEGMAVGIGMQRAAASPPARYLILLDRGRGLQGVAEVPRAFASRFLFTGENL